MAFGMNGPPALQLVFRLGPALLWACEKPENREANQLCFPHLLGCCQWLFCGINENLMMCYIFTIGTKCIGFGKTVNFPYVLAKEKRPQQVIKMQCFSQDLSQGFLTCRGLFSWAQWFSSGGAHVGLNDVQPPRLRLEPAH